MHTLTDIKLAVIGLGYVGLPLAVEFAKQRAPSSVLTPTSSASLPSERGMTRRWKCRTMNCARRRAYATRRTPAISPPLPRI